MSFDQAFAFTMKAEGGFVDNAADHGGPTNHGITQATYDYYRDTVKDPRQSVALITGAETAFIYKMGYWEPAKCDLLPTRLGVCHLDWAINHGVPGAIETLQQALGVTADGLWGPQTAAAVAAADDAETCAKYNLLREEWYRARVQVRPDQGVFLNGWLDRIVALNAYVAGLTAP